MPEGSLSDATPPIVTRTDQPPIGGGPAVLLMDKPGGLSSFDVIRRLRPLLGTKKIGHAGTLDPMATGLLICLVGRQATRLQDQFMGLPKTYTGTLRLGEVTPSYDAESEVIERVDASHVTDEQLDAVRQPLLGEIEQQPPMYSAVKVGGERLYKKARRGETIERVARPVSVYRFDLTARRGADVDFLIECSKGTYVRTLAHDLGQALGVGAHLTALRRAAIGPFGVDEAWGLEALRDAIAPA
ncbi:MAG: tRNA pseudouridine(55) synthase TruB [Rhodothermales bacterium]